MNSRAMHSLALPSRWWRYPAPLLLLLALASFFCPWLGVIWKDPEPNAKPEPVAWQSGLQSTCGSLTVPMFQFHPLRLENGDGTVRIAPLMGLYAFWLVLGSALGLAGSLSTRRVQLVGLCAMAAAGLLFAQTFLEFPLSREVMAHNSVRSAAAGDWVVSYTPCFYGAWVTTLFSVVLVMAEWNCCYRHAVPAPKSTGSREAASGEETRKTPS